MIVGEGPGYNEDLKGEPFVGATGMFLKQELARYGIKDFALSNATRCFPGEDKKEGEMNLAMAACNPYLMEDIQAVKPKVIIALGAYAIRAMGFDDPINTIIAHVLEGPYGAAVIPSYHPALFMRDISGVELFQLAVYKARLLLAGKSLGTFWPPERDWEAHYSGNVTIDTETSSKNPRLAKLVMATVTSDYGTVVVRPENHMAMEWLAKMWGDPNVHKNFQNGDYDVQVLEKELGIAVQGWDWDTLLAEHVGVREEGHFNLETLRGTYTNQPVYERELRLWKEEKIEIPAGVRYKKIKTKVEDGLYKNGNQKFKNVESIVEVPKFKIVKRGDNMDGYAGVPRRILEPYGIYDSQTTHLVKREQVKRIAPAQVELLQQVVLPAQLALIDMEREGIRVDMAKVPVFRDKYIARCEELKQEIFQAVDEEFKVTSPLEVQRILYEELGLPKPPVKSKTTGKAGTGKKALDWLMSNANHPVLKPLEEWRSMNQIVKNFLQDENGKGLMSHVEEGRLHTTYRLTLETGRTATSPNLQNLPTEAKGKQGNLRELLIADTGNVLVQADYSQVELRIASYESNDTQLITMLESGGDVHTHFARRLYPFEVGLSDAEWKKKYDQYRTLAKRFTFGRLFGQTEVGMALTFNIPKEEALRFQAVYTELFPGMGKWWEEIISHVRSGEPLQTKWGRLRHFPAFTIFRDLNWRGKNGLLSHMEREALNFMPQGSAADCILKAMGVMKQRIDNEKLPFRMRLDVHDSITLECKEQDKEWCAAFCYDVMPAVATHFGWKLPVEVKWGYDWSAEGGKL